MFFPHRESRLSMRQVKLKLENLRLVALRLIMTATKVTPYSLKTRQ